MQKVAKTVTNIIFMSSFLVSTLYSRNGLTFNREKMHVMMKF